MTLCEKMKLVITDLEREFELSFGITVERAIVRPLDDQEQWIEDFKSDGMPDWFIEEHRKGYCCLELGIAVEHPDEPFVEFNEDKFQTRLREIFRKHLPEECLPVLIECDFRDQEFMTSEYGKACERLANE